MTGPVRHLTVAAGVLRDEAGRILLTRRPAGRHMGGLWEFPGGKVEAGESPRAALARELREELGIHVQPRGLLHRSRHHEPGLVIDLLFFKVDAGEGSPAPLEGLEIVWVGPEELPRYPMPPADAGLVAFLRAPSTRGEKGPIF